MKKESVTWTGMDIDYRTDKRALNDIFCMACRAKLGRVVDHNLIYLNGWDRQPVFNIELGTVTVKCKCGVGRVIRNRGNHDEGSKESMNVWLQEINEGSGGEHQSHSQRES